ncbi:hypothetical protein MD484_g5418, partial [Candolleomyces efflorescens]
MQTRSSSKRSIDTPASPNRRIEDQKRLVLPELGPVIELENHFFARSLYRNLASTSAIDSFLRTSRLYSIPERRWKLPQNYSKLLDTNCYTPFLNIISSIVRRFWGDVARQRSREIIDTHATNLQHSPVDPPAHVSGPALVIKAKGSSFQLPRTRKGESPSKLGFSNITTCVEIHIDDTARPVSEQLAQAAIYARQIFIEQPNRRFVRVLDITGHHLRLFHFDRSGALYTPPLDFHDDPRTFVRLIVGLSSPNEADIGLDTSIRWKIDNERKVRGTLTTRGTDNTEKVYHLVYVDPVFNRFDIQGRGTTCWVVWDPPSGEFLLIKNAWRLDSRTAEFVHLREASGLPGVAQMVSCEPDRGDTRALRSLTQEDSVEFGNRVDTRVVMKCYGRSIVHFTSAKQLLCALRDAIAGHRNLFKKGILHRDVSINNIVLGNSRAKPGERGILIDLDVATRCNEAGVHPDLDWRIGAQIFQSIILLYSTEFEDPDEVIPHDHLDDLESFIYVLAYIIYHYDCHGVSYPPDKLLKIWDTSKPIRAAESKEVFLVRTDFMPNLNALISRWPKAVLDVFSNFRRFLLPFWQTKLSFMSIDLEEVPKTLQRLASDADHHYDEIIRIFDEGIDSLERMDTEAGSPKMPAEKVPSPVRSSP